MGDIVGQLVDKATSQYLINPDWNINMQLCDIVNRDPSAAREAVKCATKKLKEKKSRVQLFALELLATLVKNCESTHVHVGAKECQAEIIKLAQTKKTKDHVRDRVLDLVQYWADSFSARHDLPLFTQTHLLLRRAGIPFPPRNKSEPPLVFKTPASHTRAPSSSSLSSGDRQPSSRGSMSVGSMPKEFVAMRESINLANEMLAFINPEEEDPNNNDILKELIENCKEYMPNIRSAIESGNFTSEEAMLEMITLNDELLKVQEAFDLLLAKRKSFLQHGPSPPRRMTPPPSSLLDLTSDLGNMRVGNSQQSHPQQQQQQQQRPVLDEFDLLGLPASKGAPTRIDPTNPFYMPTPVAPTASAPPMATPHDAFDEFDLLAHRHDAPASTTTSGAKPLVQQVSQPNLLSTTNYPSITTSYSASSLYTQKPAAPYTQPSLQPTPTSYSNPASTSFTNPGASSFPRPPSTAYPQSTTSAYPQSTTSAYPQTTTTTSSYPLSTSPYNQAGFNTAPATLTPTSSTLSPTSSILTPSPSTLTPTATAAYGTSYKPSAQQPSLATSPNAYNTNYLATSPTAYGSFPGYNSMGQMGGQMGGMGGGGMGQMGGGYPIQPQPMGGKPMPYGQSPYGSYPQPQQQQQQQYYGQMGGYPPTK